MPCEGYGDRIDWRLMDQCRREAKAQMERDGFSAGRFKFDEVCNRRANRLYRERSK